MSVDVTVKIVYGYPVYDFEFDLNFIEDLYREQNDGADYEDDYRTIKDWFINEYLEDYCHSYTYLGVPQENYIIFGEAWVSGFGISKFSVDKLIEYTGKETRYRIAKDFKRYFPYLSEREPGYYIIVSYD